MDQSNGRGTGRRETDKRLRKSVSFLGVLLVALGFISALFVILLLGVINSTKVEKEIAYVKGKTAGFSECRQMYDEVIDPLLKETP